MSLFHVTGAYMDFSGPLDAANPPGRAYGCQFEVGGGFVPAGADPLHPVPHAVCYPLEGSALYLLTAAQGPVQKRYVLRHFILGYPSGAVVVGWYLHTAQHLVLDLDPVVLHLHHTLLE